MAWSRSALALTLGLAFAAGCASKTAPADAPTAPTRSSPSLSGIDTTQPAAAQSFDAVAARIAAANVHVERGERMLGLSPDAARSEFNAGLRVLLEAPRGEAGDSRLHVERERLIELVSLVEASALAEQARESDPAPDDRLALVVFPAPASPAPVDDPLEGLERLPDVPIPSNDRVRAAVESLRGVSREVVTAGLTRAGSYLPMIRRIFREQGLPESLAYLPIVESSYRASAVSRSRAQGMWQFMRATAREYGLRQDWYIDERSDPEKATVAAARYLRFLFGMFDRDWHLALAAYNAGPGRVQRAVRRSGSNDYWTITSSSKYLPRETRQYVPLALAAMLIGSSPSRYGFDIEPDEPLRYAKVEVSSAIDLKRIAEWSGAPLETIERLNPELLRWMTPFDLSDYAIKIPEGTEDRLRERIAAASPDELVSPRWYTVARGDSLWLIARNMNITRVELASANRLSPNARLSIGQRLLVPGGPSAPASSGRSAAAVRTAPSIEADGRVVYRVRTGDTLFAIARVFDTTVAVLKRLNNLRSNLIRPGDRLTISLPRFR